VLCHLNLFQLPTFVHCLHKEDTMFKTMDGVEVYDKADVDGIIEPLTENVTTLIDQMSTKADKSEIRGIVDSEIDAVIDEKIAEIVPDIDEVVDREIVNVLEDYDTSSEVDTKIANATVPMTTTAATSLVDTYF